MMSVGRHWVLAAIPAAILVAGCGSSHGNSGDGGSGDRPAGECGKEAGGPCCDDGTCVEGLECLHTTCFIARKGDLGKECDNAFDCSERQCLPVVFDQGSSVGQNACTYSCGKDSDCLPGWECLALAGGSGKVCQCSMGQYVATENAEACDGRDDNCNGYVDDHVLDCSKIQACLDGKCQCQATACGGACVDLQSDAANCGTCGHDCGANHVCKAATCVPGCGSYLALLGDQCVDPQRCYDLGYDVCSSSGSSSEDLYCLPIETDPLNCGGCGLVCPAPDHGTAVCISWACDYQCDPGYERGGYYECVQADAGVQADAPIQQDSGQQDTSPQQDAGSCVGSGGASTAGVCTTSLKCNCPNDCVKLDDSLSSGSCWPSGAGGCANPTDAFIWFATGDPGHCYPTAPITGSFSVPIGTMSTAGGTSDVTVNINGTNATFGKGWAEHDTANSIWRIYLIPTSTTSPFPALNILIADSQYNTTTPITWKDNAFSWFWLEEVVETPASDTLKAQGYDGTTTLTSTPTSAPGTVAGSFTNAHMFEFTWEICGSHTTAC